MLPHSVTYINMFTVYSLKWTCWQIIHMQTHSYIHTHMVTHSLINTDVLTPSLPHVNLLMLLLLLLLTRFSRVRLCVTPWTVAHQAPPSLGFSRQEHGWVAISFSNAWKWKVKGKSLSRVWLLATPWTVAHQTSPSMGFSRQEYWSGVPLPSPKHAHRCIQIGRHN